MVCAWDPGVSTGVALVNSDGSVEYTETLSTLGAVTALAASFKNLQVRNFMSVVIEEPPQSGGHYRPHTQQVENCLREAFPDARWVRPAEWKGHPAAKAGPSLKGKTQHEKDVVCMARWFRTISAQEASR